MKALVFERSEIRYVAAVVASKVARSSAAQVGPLRLKDIDAPQLPGNDWQVMYPRLAGVCGSDLATVEGRSSRYFESHVSFPFVPGHEVVGDLADGTRVALEPILGAEARGEEPPFEGAAPGDGDDYGYLLGDAVDTGIQTGFCSSTGGGWGTQLVAHKSQLHSVPEQLSDESAVMLEPAAGGVHAALRAGIKDGDVVVIQGAGTMGLVTLAAVAKYTNPAEIIVAAKYPHQKELARSLGATTVVSPSEMKRAVRRHVGCRMIGDDLTGGADVTIDAVGSASSIADSISVTRPRGRVLLLGMPGVTKLDLTPLWHRETELVGAYTYCTEHLDDGTHTTSFKMAFDLVAKAKLDRLVSAHYPISEYKAALRHASEAGPRGAVKIVFDLRDERN